MDKMAEQVKARNLPGRSSQPLLVNETSDTKAPENITSPRTNLSVRIIQDQPGDEGGTNLFDELTGNTTLSNSYVRRATLESGKITKEIKPATNVPKTRVTPEVVSNSKDKEVEQPSKTRAEKQKPESSGAQRKTRDRIFGKLRFPFFRGLKRGAPKAATPNDTTDQEKTEMHKLDRIVMGVMNAKRTARRMVEPPVAEIVADASFEPSKLTADSSRWGLTEIQNDLHLLKYAVEKEKIEHRDREYIERARDYRVEARSLLVRADSIVDTDGLEAEHLIRKANAYATQARRLFAKVSAERESRQEKAKTNYDISNTTSSKSKGARISRSPSDDSLETSFTYRINKEDLARRLNDISLFSPQDINFYWPLAQCAEGNRSSSAEARDAIAEETYQILNALSAEEVREPAGSWTTMLGLTPTVCSAPMPLEETKRISDEQDEKAECDDIDEPLKSKGGACHDLWAMERSKTGSFCDELEAVLEGECCVKPKCDELKDLKENIPDIVVHPSCKEQDPALQENILGCEAKTDTRDGSIVVPVNSWEEENGTGFFVSDSTAARFAAQLTKSYDQQVQQARDDDNEEEHEATASQFARFRAADTEDTRMNAEALEPAAVKAGYCTDRRQVTATKKSELFDDLASVSSHGSVARERSGLLYEVSLGESGGMSYEVTLSASTADHTMAPPIHLLGSEDIAEFFLATEKVLGIHGSVDSHDSSTDSVKLRTWSFNFLSCQ
jgi:hypothetical protein